MPEDVLELVGRLAHEAAQVEGGAEPDDQVGRARDGDLRLDDVELEELRLGRLGVQLALVDARVGVLVEILDLESPVAGGGTALVVGAGARWRGALLAHGRERAHLESVVLDDGVGVVCSVGRNTVSGGLVGLSRGVGARPRLLTGEELEVGRASDPRDAHVGARLQRAGQHDRLALVVAIINYRQSVGCD